MAKGIFKKAHHILSPLRDFFNDSRSVGIILIACTAVSMLLSNLSSTQTGYLSIFHTPISKIDSFIKLPEDFLGWINDVLMTIFFFLVGMEIKRELTVGELASIKKSLLPVLAAFGGMVCPAIIFNVFNGNTEFHHGWGIPMATDIAFSLGVLSLLGKRVPVQLKIFLAALAIIDDLGAVLTIAIFYTSKIQLLYLFGGLIAATTAIFMNIKKVNRLVFYVFPAIALWVCLFNSGIHPTISGVVMAFSMPLSKLEKFEHYLHKPVNFFIMPLFALANTAIILPADLSVAFASTISLGVIFGLVLGKPLGIFLFSYIGQKTGIAALPAKTSYKQLLGIGMLGGIGFTMSIFTSSLAYTNENAQVIAKVCTIVASVCSGVIGFFYLRLVKSPVEQLEGHESETLGFGNESVLSPAQESPAAVSYNLISISE